VRGLAGDSAALGTVRLVRYGYCAAHSRYYWGLKLYLLAAPDGMPIAWCLADPKLGEREVCLDLLSVAVETSDAAPRTEPADPPRSSTNRRRSGWPRTCRRRRGACPSGHVSPLGHLDIDDYFAL